MRRQCAGSGRLIALSLAASLFACSSAGSEGGAGSAGVSEYECANPPVAHVLEPEGGRARALLETAGFAVRELSTDESPKDLDGLIWIGSYASERADYAMYMERYASDLYHFVDRANVLVQMAQSSSLEPEPPFLPTTHTASRREGSAEVAYVVTPSNSLLESAEIEGGALRAGGGAVISDHHFAQQGGFEVLLAMDSRGLEPILMEGAYGQGRIVLSALSFDAAAGPELDALSEAFFDNLLGRTTAVCGRSTDAIGVTSVTGDVDSLGEDAFTIAVLPDTQIYALRAPGLFTLQTGWIASQVEALRIAYVLHLGDIVNNNTDLEWARASEAMEVLNGVVPYALVPGNHDYGPSGDASTRDTKLNDYFDFNVSASMPSFGGAYIDGQLDNTYHLFSGGGRDFIIIALEWGPRDEVIGWANELMSAHSDRLGILLTHAYLNHNDRRYDHTDTQHPQHYNPHEYATPGGVNDGEELWQKLVRHNNFVLTINGHVLEDGTGYLASTNDQGRTVHQMLVNYQMRELGGEAYLRLLQFSNGARNVRVLSYSPLYDSYLEQADQQFVFALDID